MPQVARLMKIAYKVLLSTADGNGKWYNHLGRQLKSFVIRLNIHVTYQVYSAIYPTEMKMGRWRVERQVCFVGVTGMQSKLEWVEACVGSTDVEKWQ